MSAERSGREVEVEREEEEEEDGVERSRAERR